MVSAAMSEVVAVSRIQEDAPFLRLQERAKVEMSTWIMPAPIPTMVCFPPRYANESSEERERYRQSKFSKLDDLIMSPVDADNSKSPQLFNPPPL